MERVAETIGTARVVPVIRTTESGLASMAGEALIAGGARVLEVALTCPDAFDTIAGLAQKVTTGAASVSSVEMVERAVRLGAAFTVSPHLDPALLDRARELGVIHIPGTATPTEVVTAVKSGAILVKLFPAKELGGPAYLRALLAPLPDVKLIPAGGISLEEVGKYLEAGAFAVALGSGLAADGWGALTETMRRLVDGLP